MVLSPKLVSWHSAVHIHVYSQFTLQQFITSSFIAKFICIYSCTKRSGYIGSVLI